MTPPHLEQWRRETPGTTTRKHLNNAGAGLMPQVVLDAAVGYLNREALTGGYELAALEADTIAGTYQSLSLLIGSQARNIAIVENATVAFWQALAAFDFAPGDRIVTTRHDYASHQITYLTLKERRGVDTVVVREAPAGGADLDDFKRHLSHARSRLATICWSPTNSGILQDVPALVALCREAGVPSLVDGCQAVGQFPVDCNAIGCDFLTGTARKFLRGPRGLGFLHVSDRMLEQGKYPINLDGRGATWEEANRFTVSPTARRFENWEFSDALVVAMGAAAAYAMKVGVAVASERAFALAARARARLATIPGVTILDRGQRLGAIVSARIDNWDANDVVHELRVRHINTSAAERAWALLDMDAKASKTALRVSPHYYNTESEIDDLELALREIISARSTTHRSPD
jgi:selenocysteine lyase/cysteine desulfurase